MPSRRSAIYRRHDSNHHGRVGLATSRIRRARENLAISVDDVNLQLDEFSCTGVRLRVEDGLEYQVLGLQQAAFTDGAKPASLSRPKEFLHHRRGLVGDR
jgi:hypothetical protein